MGKSKQPYYDNNWELYKKAPDDFFVPHTYDEVMEWKVAGWELPASVCCLIRVMSTKNGKVKEFIYRSPSAAQKKVHKLFQQSDIEFTVADHESIHHFYPEDRGDVSFEYESDDEETDT